MKFSKRLKAMAAAIAMLTLSTAGAVTGTVAWFTANNTVVASGMNIQAETENGIVIANETHTADSHWLTTVTASHDGAGAKFIPTSTNNLTTWYHGLSDRADNGQSNVNYDQFATPTDANSDGVFTATSTNHFSTDAKNVYLLNNFFVQASAKADITNQDIFIEEIAISGISSSANLDKSIRVGLMVKDVKVGIYAPLANATLTHGVNGGASSTVAIDVSADNDRNLAYTGDIPAYTTAGTNAIKFSVFVYFEGEDVNHKSANIQETLDTLALSFKLRNANHA